MKIEQRSDPTIVMRTKCERCSVEGYIFPDRLKRNESYSIGARYYSSCCNREKNSKCLYFISPDRAIKLQRIRRRKTTVNPNQAIANW